MKQTNPDWRKWLRACERDQTANGARILPYRPPGPVAMLTGTDAKALDAIAACWTLYAFTRDQRVLGAVRSILPLMQEKCWGFARELIAWAMDWNDRHALWTLVTAPLEPPMKFPPIECHRCSGRGMLGDDLCPQCNGSGFVDRGST